jgi:hypothetical protein
LHETDEAWLLNIDGDKHWVPKACIENNADLEVGEEVEVEIHEWFAIEERIV